MVCTVPYIQWNLSNPGTEESSILSEVSLFQGLIESHARTVLGGKKRCPYTVQKLNFVALNFRAIHKNCISWVSLERGTGKWHNLIRQLRTWAHFTC